MTKRFDGERSRSVPLEYWLQSARFKKTGCLLLTKSRSIAQVPRMWAIYVVEPRGINHAIVRIRGWAQPPLEPLTHLSSTFKDVGILYSATYWDVCWSCYWIAKDSIGRGMWYRYLEHRLSQQSIRAEYFPYTYVVTNSWTPEFPTSVRGSFLPSFISRQQQWKERLFVVVSGCIYLIGLSVVRRSCRR